MMAGRLKPKQRDGYFRLGFLVHDVSRLRRTVADKALRPLGITRSQFWVLSNLDRHKGDSMVQTELATVLDLGKNALGGLLDRLEAIGAIARVADPQDRRAKRVQMTPFGEDLLKRAKEFAVNVNEEMMQGVSSAEIAMAEDILYRMKQRLITMDDDGKPTAAERQSLTDIARSVRDGTAGSGAGVSR